MKTCDINTFIAKHHRKRGKTPILFFHSWNQDNEMEYQGYITHLRKDGTGEAQLLNWTFGEPGDIMRFTKAFLECCTFYTSDRDMREAAKIAHCERVRLFGKGAA